ncbi:TPA: hypothetical protein ACJI3K_004402, partial [Klebsiella oxytoca]
SVVDSHSSAPCFNPKPEAKTPAIAGRGFAEKLKLTVKSALYPISSGTRGGGMRVVAHNVSHHVSQVKL